jgi:predicted CoA-binding protein
MVPTLVPAPVAVVVVVGAAVAGEVAAPVGAAAALPVWAQAEITEKAAMARTDRRNLLVIGSLKLLGTWFQ